MSWTKDHPRRRGELEFHLPGEVPGTDAQRVEKAMARHERRHHPPQ